MKQCFIWLLRFRCFPYPEPYRADALEGGGSDNITVLVLDAHNEEGDDGGKQDAFFHGR